jgi:hypothetical protein
VPGQRQARFLALGDGSDTLRVAYADGDVEIVEGDLAWAIDPPRDEPRGGAITRIVGGALLGRIVRGDAPAGADRVDWRVAPLASLATLAEVAVRLPPGFPRARRAQPRAAPGRPRGRPRRSIGGAPASCCRPAARRASSPAAPSRRVPSSWGGSSVRAGSSRSRSRCAIRGCAAACCCSAAAARRRGRSRRRGAEGRRAAARARRAAAAGRVRRCARRQRAEQRGGTRGLLLGTLELEDAGVAGTSRAWLRAATAELDAVVIHRPPGAWSER